MLTGRVPFEREGDEAKLWAQLSEPPPVPSALRPGLPRELDAVVARAMAKAPDARYPSAGDLGRAARAAAAGGSPSQPERMVARGAAAPAGAATEPGIAGEASTVSAPRPAPARPHRGRRRRRLAAIAAAAAAGAGVAAVLALTSGGDEPGGAAHAGSARPSPRASPTAAAAAHTRIRDTQTIHHIGHRPNAIAVAGGDLWVTSADRPRMTRIDAATFRERRQHPNVGVGAKAIASAGTSVWVAVGTQGQVVRIDARTGRVRKRIQTHATPSRVTFGLGSLWVGARTGPPWLGQLIRYSPAGHELRRIPLPKVASAVVTGGGFVWVALEEDPRLLRIDPRTGGWTVRTELAAPGSALSYGAGFVWVTLTKIDSIARVNPHGGAPATTGVGHRPAQSVTAGGHVYVAVNADHVVQAVDPKSARLAGSPLRVDLNPYAIAADDRDVWVTGLTENTVTRIPYR
jgi:hypothetical protein